MTGRPSRLAFARVELCAVLAILIIGLALAFIAADASRRNANLGQDIVKLHTIAQATALYGNDNADRIWALSWKANTVYNTPWPELNLAPSDTMAQANQAVYILRTHGNRPQMPTWGNIIPTVRYSHLPLAVYLNQPLPWLTFISSGDRDRLRWAMDPDGFNAGAFVPCQPSPISPQQRCHPFSASFELTVSAWDRGEVGQRVHASSNEFYFLPFNHQFGGGLLTDVAHPGQKVLVLDEYARHFGEGTQYLYNHPEAKLPLMFADGSTRLKKTRDSNPGWQPNQPHLPQPMLLQSFARSGQCTPGTPPPGGVQTTLGPMAPGVFKWTRSGLAGRDFGGPEVWLLEDVARQGAAVRAHTPHTHGRGEFPKAAPPPVPTLVEP